MTTDPIPQDTARPAALAGGASAGLALALTELMAGLTDAVPSAIASVGSIVVDNTPGFVERTAISVFGTADKGALAIGTVILAVVVGAIVGVLARRRRWVIGAAFGAFALLGLGAVLNQPTYEPVITVITVVGAALIGGGALDRLLTRLMTPQPVAPTDGLAGSPSRRAFVAGVAGVGASAVAAGAIGRSLIISRSEEVRSTIALPAAQTVARLPGPDSSFPVSGLESIVVPNAAFYRIDTALIVPRPDTNTWRVRVMGMVDNVLSFTLSDLMAMPLHEEYVTIACVSNEVGGDLVGNAKWTGVRLSELLDRAGVHPGADQVVGRSTDGWTAGFPTSVVFDGREPLVAIGMNDEMLPQRHGYPARLIVPGLYGYVSATKWLSEIELTTWDAFDGYWIPRGWSKEGPIKTQSRIDVPESGRRVDGGSVVMAGVAWAPLKGVAGVQVRVDDGPWEDAELSEPLSDKAWVQWRHVKELPSEGRYRLQVRATDGTGQTQTSALAPPAPDGATGYHTIEFFTA